jgi:NADPH:quinone reductase-like Zn-dependent oxidoreductase
MKAAILEKYGAPEVLKIKEVPKPKISNKEILIKLDSVAITSADSRIRGARFPKGFGFLARLAFGITKPRIKILGSTYSGVVHEVGGKISEYKVGDEVCGMTGIKMGAYAEFIKLSNFKSVTLKPTKVSHGDAAAMLFGGTAALYFIRDKLLIKNGEEILINGASGAVGSNAVQLARYYGAKVTALTSGDNEEFIKKYRSS